MKEWVVPVGPSTSLFLDLPGVVVEAIGFTKEAREVLLRSGGAVSKAGVVTVIGFVGTSHCGLC